jgi:hypothetical protein
MVTNYDKMNQAYKNDTKVILPKRITLYGTI